MTLSLSPLASTCSLPLARFRLLAFACYFFRFLSPSIYLTFRSLTSLVSRSSIFLSLALSYTLFSRSIDSLISARLCPLTVLPVLHFPSSSSFMMPGTARPADARMQLRYSTSPMTRRSIKRETVFIEPQSMGDVIEVIASPPAIKPGRSVQRSFDASDVSVSDASSVLANGGLPTPCSNAAPSEELFPRNQEFDTGEFQLPWQNARC